MTGRLARLIPVESGKLLASIKSSMKKIWRRVLIQRRRG